MDGSEQLAIKGVEEIVGRFSGELIPQLDRWTRRLVAEPESLEELERGIHASFSRGADVVCIGLIAALMAEPEFEKQAERSRPLIAHRRDADPERTTRRVPGSTSRWPISDSERGEPGTAEPSRPQSRSLSFDPFAAPGASAGVGRFERQSGSANYRPEIKQS